MPDSKIRIAITGGGVAGASLLHALLQYSHLDVHIFESAPQFREAGIVFGLTINASRALEQIGPSATACVERAGGMQMKGTQARMGQGEHTGEQILKLSPGPTVIQRANILRELLADTPPQRMHASKKLAKIDVQDECVLLHFADGSTHECDILVGADGVHSMVRRFILGADDPAAIPQKSPWWAIMTLNPYDKARASIGSASIDYELAREYGWVGKNTMMWSNIVSNGEMVQFSMLSCDEIPGESEADASNRWTSTITAETLKKLYHGNGWAAHLDKAVLDLLCDQPSRQAISVWEHLPARTYVDGPVCVFGDAAHATTPFQGSGGSMCVEDSMILSTLLGRSKSPSEAMVALKVYDEVRRPRTQRVVTSSHETGLLITGTHKVGGLDPEKLRELLAHRWDFIKEIDIAKYKEDAVNLMDAELRRDSGVEAKKEVD